MSFFQTDDASVPHAKRPKFNDDDDDDKKDEPKFPQKGYSAGQ